MPRHRGWICDDACSLIEKYSAQKVSFQEVSRGEVGVEGWGADYNLVSECGKTRTRVKRSQNIESNMFWSFTWLVDNLRSLHWKFENGFSGNANWEWKMRFALNMFSIPVPILIEIFNGNGLIQFVTQLTSRWEPWMEGQSILMNQILPPGETLARWRCSVFILKYNLERDMELFVYLREGSRRPLKARVIIFHSNLARGPLNRFSK